jgi:ubiquinone biosynthesis protein
VREKIDADLRLLRRVSELIESEIPEARRYRPAEVAAQFARTLEREADFVTETRNIQRFQKNFAGDPNVVIPRIYPEYTSDVLLVQEHVDGIPPPTRRRSTPPASTARRSPRAASTRS